jgi:hypothetical protein
MAKTFSVLPVSITVPVPELFQVISTVWVPLAAEAIHVKDRESQQNVGYRNSCAIFGSHGFPSMAQLSCGMMVCVDDGATTPLALNVMVR